MFLLKPWIISQNQVDYDTLDATYSPEITMLFWANIFVVYLLRTVRMWVYALSTERNHTHTWEINVPYCKQCYEE